MSMTDAEMRDLTRQRRRERLERIPTLRFTGLGPEFEVAITAEVGGGRYRRSAAHRIWKAREWREGRRHCAYCGVRTVRRINQRDTMTLDHKEPLALNGADDPSNWCVACLDCNGRKAAMPEAEFRALLTAD